VAVVKLWQAVLLAVVLAWLLLVIVTSLHGQPPSPGTPIAATASVGILVGGRPIAAEPNINFASGNGIVETAVDNPAASRVDVTPGFNTALIPTHDTVHANENFCDSTNGTTLYTCKLPNKALLIYQRGQTFLLVADATCAMPCSLNIDTLGPISIKQADGTTDPVGQLVAGQPKWIWFDGKIFRLL